MDGKLFKGSHPQIFSIQQGFSQPVFRESLNPEHIYLSRPPMFVPCTYCMYVCLYVYKQSMYKL